MKITQLPDGPYNAQETETDILKNWLEQKLYKPETAREILIKQGRYPGILEEERYTIVNPPPNAYARPHMGNVSGYAYQDLFGRRARMQGKVTLLFPGKDHAAQQAEIVYTREVLEPQGKKRTDFTREEFYDQAYEYFTKIMAIAQEDEKRVGLSADFDRDLFTLDPRVGATVYKTFAQMWQDKLVYKGVRVVNWSPGLNSAVADIDTERLTVDGQMYYLKYSLPEVDQDITDMRAKFADQSFALTVTEEVEIPDPKLKKQAVQAQLHLIKGTTDISGEITAWVQAPEAVIGQTIEVKSQGMVIPLTHEPILILGEAFPDKKSQLIIFKASNLIFGSAFTKSFTSETEVNQSVTWARGFIIGTVRPETKFGDTAIAVNPEDKRFQKFIGTEIALTGAQGSVKMRIIGENSIDMNFGSGLLKVTPAHSPTDYDIFVRYNIANPDAQIDYLNVIEKDSTLNHLAGKYTGKHAENDRKEIADQMATDGFIVFAEFVQSNITICERTKTVIQPIMSSQWFIDTDKLKIPALEAVRAGKVKINPDYMTKKLEIWLENLRDWPISRSIWWGYRIPVWYKGEVVEKTDTKGHVLVEIGGQTVEDMEDAIEKGLMKLDLRPGFAPILVPGRTAPENSTLFADIKRKYSWAQIVNTGRKDQDYTDYKKAFAKISFDTKSTVVAHSLGAPAVIDYLLETGKKVDTMILLAPSNDKSEHFADYQARGFWKNWEKLAEGYKSYCEKLIVIYSDNDEFYKQADFETFADYIKADEKILESGKGHFLTNKYRHDSVELEKLLANIATESELAMAAQVAQLESEGWTQDTDVFDTWFSSGQWPYATLESEGLLEYYPTSLMETGFDILELWVSRMIMLGIYTQGEVPFTDVYLHGLIKAEDGQKMSKSKGNIVYTEDIINEHGADTLRLFYIVGNKAGASYRVDARKIKGYRNFLNKLWNGTRFVLQNLDNHPETKAEANFTQIAQILSGYTTAKRVPADSQADYIGLTETELTGLSRQMLESLNLLVAKVNNHLNNFRPGMAAEEIIQHYWHVFADVYVEKVKSALYLKDREGNLINQTDEAQSVRNKALATLIYSIRVYLQLLHPFVPFITESIWANLPEEVKDSESIMYSSWPE